MTSLYTDFDHANPPLGPDGTPYDFFEALRDEALETETPIGWSKEYGGFWVATGFEVVRDIFQDTQRFSNRGVTFPAYDVGEDSTLMLAAQDPPAHDKYRKLVQSAFGPRKVQDFGDELTRTTNNLIDQFIEDGEVELVAALTDEVPARLTAIILGLDPEDGELYRKWVWAMSHLFLTDPDTAGKHVAEMDAYFVEELARRKKNLGDDVLSRVIQAENDGERLTDQEIKDFFIVLLIGGIENTSKLLATMFWRLGWDVEARRRMTKLKDTKMIVAMDEFLRCYPPAYLARLITEDVEIGGVKMEEGQHVVLHLQTANRDPRAFEHPDVLVLDRSPNKHFALGNGIHRCLGAHLVRFEGRIVAEAMIDRIPEFQLDASKPPTWISGQVSGIGEVHLTFPPGGGRRNEAPTLTEAA
jgi:hypothetical protein